MKNMKTKKMILPMLCCVPLLGSCTGWQTSGNQAWSVKPTYSVNGTAGSPVAMYQLGRYYQGQRRYQQAADAYIRALVMDSGFVEARNGLGVVYSMQGKHEEAFAEFRAAISHAPEAAHLYNNLGHALCLRGDYAEAVPVLERAAALDPANQRTLSNLALAYAKTGEGGKSRQALAQAVGQPSAGELAPPADSGAAAAPQMVSQAIAPARDTGIIVIRQAAAANPLPVAESRTQPAAVPQVAFPVIAPARDTGIIVIRQAAAADPLPVAESRTQPVEVTPSVYPLRERAAEPVSIVTVAATEQPAAVTPADPVRIATVAATEQPAAVTLADPARFRLEVSNGNGVTGMARKVGRFLGGQGYRTARLTNRKPFRVAATQIQYRPGYQAEAQRLKSNLPGEPALVQNDKLRPDIHVRLVLGKDMMRNMAHFESADRKIKMARNGSAS